jgi:hypothetical protein
MCTRTQDSRTIGAISNQDKIRQQCDAMCVNAKYVDGFMKIDEVAAREMRVCPAARSSMQFPDAAISKIYRIGKERRWSGTARQIDARAEVDLQKGPGGLGSMRSISWPAAQSGNQCHKPRPDESRVPSGSAFCESNRYAARSCENRSRYPFPRSRQAIPAW